MLNSIAAALRAGLRVFWGAFETVWDQAFKLFIVAPFRLVAGHGPTSQPTAHFEPSITPVALLEDLKQQSTRTAALRELDRDGLRTVTSYIKAMPFNRPTVDLSGLPKDVRATLITMTDLELRTLGNGGPGAIRKFIIGRDHGVHGVPVVRPVAVKPAVNTVATPDENTAYDLLVRRIQAGMRDPRSKAFAMPKM